MNLTLFKQEKPFFSSLTEDLDSYFEWGCGGTTVHVSNKTPAKVHSIDTSQEWLEKVNKNIKDKNKVVLEHIDVGPTGAWGRPVDESKKHLWHNYYEAIYNTKIYPELIFIDGRFRRACALTAIKYAKDNKINPSIAIHDVSRYIKDLCPKYLKLKERVFQLGVFEAKINIDMDELEKDLERFKFIIR